MHLELPHALASVIKSGISLRSLKQLRDLLVNEPTHTEGSLL